MIFILMLSSNIASYVATVAIASQLVSSKGFRAIALRYTVRYRHDSAMVKYIATV